MWSFAMTFMKIKLYFVQNWLEHCTIIRTDNVSGNILFNTYVD